MFNQILDIIDNSTFGQFLSPYLTSTPFKPSHLVLLFIIVFLFFYILQKLLKGSVKRDTLLLLGLMNSGKTALFYKLKYGKNVETHTSMRENEGTFPIYTSPNEQSPKPIHVVDIPGHESIRRTRLRHYMPIAKSILFILDSFNIMSEIHQTAEYIYELLTNEDIVKNRIPINIICNKIEMALYHKSSIQKQLEKEIEKIRKTKTKQLDAVDGSQSNMHLIIGSNESFSFDKHSTTRVTFTECSLLKDKNVDEVCKLILDQV